MKLFYLLFNSVCLTFLIEDYLQILLGNNNLMSVTSSSNLSHFQNNQFLRSQVMNYVQQIYELNDSYERRYLHLLESTLFIINEFSNLLSIDLSNFCPFRCKKVRSQIKKIDDAFKSRGLKNLNDLKSCIGKTPLDSFIKICTLNTIRNYDSYVNDLRNFIEKVSGSPHFQDIEARKCRRFEKTIENNYRLLNCHLEICSLELIKNKNSLEKKYKSLLHKFSDLSNSILKIIVFGFSSKNNAINEDELEDLKQRINDLKNCNNLDKGGMGNINIPGLNEKNSCDTREKFGDKDRPVDEKLEDKFKNSLNKDEETSLSCSNKEKENSKSGNTLNEDKNEQTSIASENNNSLGFEEKKDKNNPNEEKQEKDKDLEDKEKETINHNFSPEKKDKDEKIEETVVSDLDLKIKDKDEKTDKVEAPNSLNPRESENKKEQEDEDIMSNSKNGSSDFNTNKSCEERDKSNDGSKNIGTNDGKTDIEENLDNKDSDKTPAKKEEDSQKKILKENSDKEKEADKENPCITDKTENTTEFTDKKKETDEETPHVTTETENSTEASDKENPHVTTETENSDGEKKPHVITETESSTESSDEETPHVTPEIKDSDEKKETDTENPQVTTETETTTEFTDKKKETSEEAPYVTTETENSTEDFDKEPPYVTNESENTTEASDKEKEIDKKEPHVTTETEDSDKETPHVTNESENTTEDSDKETPLVTTETENTSEDSDKEKETDKRDPHVTTETENTTKDFDKEKPPKGKTPSEDKDSELNGVKTGSNGANTCNKNPLKTTESEVTIKDKNKGEGDKSSIKLTDEEVCICQPIEDLQETLNRYLKDKENTKQTNSDDGCDSDDKNLNDQSKGDFEATIKPNLVKKPFDEKAEAEMKEEENLDRELSRQDVEKGIKHSDESENITSERSSTFSKNPVESHFVDKNNDRSVNELAEKHNSDTQEKDVNSEDLPKLGEKLSDKRMKTGSKEAKSNESRESSSSKKKVKKKIKPLILVQE